MRTMIRSRVAWPVLGALFVVFALAVAQEENTVVTPNVTPELPIEIETEVGPAGSLKIVPLWKEIAELLEEPYAMVCPPDDPNTLEFDESSTCIATTGRRPGFGIDMPPLRVFNPCFNVLTGQPLRMRPDGEIDWNQTGPLFDPDEEVAVGPDNVPTELRTIIGYLVADEDRNLVVANPGPEVGDAGDPDPRIPPDGTIIAEPACTADGRLVEDGEIVTELEEPVNENHFLREETDVRGLPRYLRDLYLGNESKKKGGNNGGKPKIRKAQAAAAGDDDEGDSTGGRLWGEILGKSLFWDMQVGSDSVQACGSCHFHAGVDNRTRNQVNPNTTGPDGLAAELELPGYVANGDVSATDFPFHKLNDPDLVGEPLLNPGNVASDSNDVMASMGISELKMFVDVKIEGGAYGSAFSPDDAFGVRSLLPDVGTPIPEPIAALMDANGNKLRRIEPRNTPTFHAAAFNFDNFWDGRARHDYNGGSVFGPSDPFFHVYLSCDDGLRELAAPDEAEGPLCDWTEQGGNYLGADDGEDPVPIRIRFSSLGSQSMGPPLSEFEMSFLGRNWPKIGKKLLQGGLMPGNGTPTPLANQLVAIDDSRLGDYSNQGGAACLDLERAVAEGKPGLCLTYQELIRLSFPPELWGNDGQHLAGTPVAMNADCDPGEQIEMDVTPSCDPFDGYVLEVEAGEAAALDTNQFTQMEANFSLFFGLSVQAYEQLTIPDDTPWDRFNDLYPMLGNGVAQPGEQGTLPPDRIRELVTGDPEGFLDVDLVDGIDEDVVFGFDIFAGGNLTAALPLGPRNPEGHGSNPFLRTARCMLCHLGPEQTDHTNNVNAGLLQSGTEQEFPFPPDAAEPTGVLRVVTGFSLAEELEENAQDGVEVENRNFAILEDESTPFADRVVAPASAIAFQDNGVYNIGLRPTQEDLLRGGNDPFGWPLSLAALALKNLGGADFEPCDSIADALAHPTQCAMLNFQPALGPGGGLFETVGEGFPFEGTLYEQESINPGLDLEPAHPMLPEYLAQWANNLPAGELNPLIDELAFGPNTMTPVPVAEFGEVLFGSDLHCGTYDPEAFGSGPPNFGWGPRCPNSQTGVPTNFDTPLNGTWPFPNRVARDGAAKVPQLRNVELTGPYFRTGSYLTLRQVVDFYVRGGDFPITNSEDRDPNLVDLHMQAFSFGSTIGLPAQFLDGIPDVLSQYGPMPDTNPPGCAEDPENCTPEPETSNPEEAKVAIVKFLIALTDERVAHRSAPFDQPEIFPPLDGRAPENTFGRDGLVLRSHVPCLPADGAVIDESCFTQVAPTGEAGQEERLLPFLVSSTEVEGDSNDHFDRR